MQIEILKAIRVGFGSRALAALIMFFAASTAWASALSDLAATLSPGQWAVLNSNGDASGFSASLLSTGNDNVFNYADKGAWDPLAKKVRFIGQGHYEPQKYVSYAEATNTWTLEPKPSWDCSPSCIGHAYQHNTINPATGDFFYHHFNSHAFFKFSRSTGQWSQLPKRPNGYSANGGMVCCEGVEYHPELGALTVFAGGEIQRYTDANGWSMITTGLAMGPYHNVAVYNPVHKIVVGGGGNDVRKLYKVNAAGSVSPIQDPPVQVRPASSIFTVDPASGKYLIVTANKGFYEYDVVSNSWSQLNGASMPFSNITYTIAIPIREHGVIMFARFEFSSSKVYLYKHSPGGGQPVDTIPPAAPLGVKVN
jgi:hypothetical protein